MLLSNKELSQNQLNQQVIIFIDCILIFYSNGLSLFRDASITSQHASKTLLDECFSYKTVIRYLK